MSCLALWGGGPSSFFTLENLGLSNQPTPSCSLSLAQAKKYIHKEPGWGRACVRLQRGDGGMFSGLNGGSL